MPNWCYTDCKVIGPEADIARFKQACLYLEPQPQPYGRPGVNNGLDFERVIPRPDHVLRSLEANEAKCEAIDKAMNGAVAVIVPEEDKTWLDWHCENWGTKWAARDSEYYVDEHGEHILYTSTAWSPPIPVYERIVAMFPTLSFVDFHIRDEMGNFFYKGTISTAGTDIVKDEEAMREWEEAMCSATEPPAAEPISKADSSPDSAPPF